MAVSSSIDNSRPQQHPGLHRDRRQRVGRVQSFREDITNNVQVLDELGRAFAVELKKGITHYTFNIARFYTRKDVFRSLKLGRVFGLQVQDHAPRPARRQRRVRGARVLRAVHDQHDQLRLHERRRPPSARTRAS
jgi:hypothetical protein